ncbi:MAG: hypothetical protein K0M56_03850 [Kaistella sp.]|nr:hypothetical protein [Kaistella sp.]
MKPHIFILFLLFSISGFSQKASASFSVTDSQLLQRITESPHVDLTLAEIDSTGQIIAYLQYESLELYHLRFLRAVNQLREAVMLKSALAALPQQYPELKNNQNVLRQMAEITYLKVYASGTYDLIYADVRTHYDTLQAKARDPELAVWNAEVVSGQSAEHYRKKMLDSAEKIMQNLSQAGNAAANKKLAEEGLMYYRQLTR